MKILIVSHSVNQNRVDNLRLIDRYLPRIGQNVWLGNMTQTILDDLISSIDNDKTDLTIYKNDEIYFHNGPTALDVEEKSYTISTAHKAFLADKMPTRTHVLYYVSAISALFHDMGKLSHGFQDRLRGIQSENIIRHELISYFVFLWITREGALDTDEKLIHALSLSNSTDIPDWVMDIDYFLQKLYSGDKNIISFVQKCLDRKLFSMQNTSQSIITCVAFVVLSHHRLPYISNGFNSIRENHNYIQDSKLGTTDLYDKNIKKHIFEFMGSQDGDLLYTSESEYNLKIKAHHKTIKSKRGDKAKQIAINLMEEYTLAYKRDIIEIKRLLHVVGQIFKDIYDGFCKIDFSIPYESLQDISIISRNMMIMSDNHVSDVSKREKNKYTTLVFANTNSEGLADTLKTHTTKVLIGVNTVFKNLSNLNHEIDGENAPDKLNEVASLNYEWQNKMVQNIQESYSGGGFIGLVISGTGSGKTIGSMKAINVLSDKIRTTTLLPMRSLTMQSKKSYSRIGISDRDMSLIMGGVISNEDTSEYFIEGDNEFNDIPNKKAHPIYHSAGLKGDALDRFLTSPIVVSTSDMLIDFVNMSKKSGVSLMLRSMFSDLIIDEVDLYNYEEQVILCRLIYYAGVFGRKVIACSATMSKTLSNAINDAYNHGFIVRNMFYGHNTPVQSAIISEFDTVITNNLNNVWEEFISNHIRNIELKNIKQSATVFNTTNGWERSFLDQALFFHETNACYYNNKKISVGVMRFNTIASCQNMAQYLMETNDLPNYARIVCVHSRYPMGVRNKIEMELSNLLDRNNNDISDNQYIKEITADEIMIIVVTTPLLETGRDYDFDWGLTEPCSDQSLVQFSGRIRRHRTDLWTIPNIAISDYSVSASKDYKIKNPGIDTPVITGSHNSKIIYPENALIDKEERSSVNLFNMDYYSSRIDNKLIIDGVNEKNGLKIVADLTQATLMPSDPKHNKLVPYSVPEYIRDSGYSRINKRTYTHRVWRRSDSGFYEKIYYCQADDKGNILFKQRDKVIVNIDVSNVDNWIERSLFPLRIYNIDNIESSMKITLYPKYTLQYNIFLGMRSIKD